MIYIIKETLTEVQRLPADKKTQYVSVITPAEWNEKSSGFDMGIELDLDITDIHGTRAEVNFDSLTGTFSIPRRDDISGTDIKFAFALDEKGIVFIDGSGEAEKIINILKNTTSMLVLRNTSALVGFDSKIWRNSNNLSWLNISDKLSTNCI